MIILALLEIKVNSYIRQKAREKLGLSRIIQQATRSKKGKHQAQRIVISSDYPGSRVFTVLNQRYKTIRCDLVYVESIIRITKEQC